MPGDCPRRRGDRRAGAVRGADRPSRPPPAPAAPQGAGAGSAAGARRGGGGGTGADGERLDCLRIRFNLQCQSAKTVLCPPFTQCTL